MKTFQQFTTEAYSRLDEIIMITPATKKTQSSSKSKSDKDRYGEDPSETRKRLALKVKKLKEEDEIEEGIGMTMANALGNPPALSKRMKLKQALIINKIKSDAKKNAEKKYSGKAAKELDENVSSGRTKVRNVKQRVSSAEVITNTEKQNQIAKHFSDHATKKKSAGDEAHAAATKAGKSPMEAETARQRAHRNYEKQMKRGGGSKVGI
jgi:hypothetical protein